MAIVLYPARKRKSLSFIGIKEVTVPDQSMSLKDIIKRFMRKESLPVQQEGFYEDRFGDLEKLSHEDVIVQLQRAKEIGDWLKKAKDHSDKIEAEKASAIEKASKEEAEKKAKFEAFMAKQDKDVPI